VSPLGSRWRYAELEFRYARGHERPTRIRWSPPDPAGRIVVGMPSDPDPLATVMERLGHAYVAESGELFEVHLLNVLGADGWELVATRAKDAGTSARTIHLFAQSYESADG